VRVRTFNSHTLHPDDSGNNGGTHPHSELLYITRGQAHLEWMGETYICAAPCLFLLTPNTPHRLQCHRTPIDFWFIELHVEEDDRFATAEQAIRWNRLQREADYSSPGMTAIAHTLEALVHSLEAKYAGDGEYDEEIVLLDIQKIIRLVQNRLRTNKRTVFDAHYKSTRELAQTLMRHMESNYFEPIDLAALSLQVHFNPSYLARVFKSETGVTPMQYLSNLRLSAATSFLIHTEMGIQQIAEETGFNSIHYFSRLFKRTYGVSPQQWRAKRRGAGEETADQ